MDNSDEHEIYNDLIIEIIRSSYDIVKKNFKDKHFINILHYEDENKLEIANIIPPQLKLKAFEEMCIKFEKVLEDNIQESYPVIFTIPSDCLVYCLLIKKNIFEDLT
jgi:hypothetical protein